jgi:hypothetical protein
MEPHFLNARGAAAADKVEGLHGKETTAEYLDALERLTAVANEGSLDAAEFLAEVLSRKGPRHDAAAAYIWYFVALHQQGYLTTFDHSNVAPPYSGPAGDFRNESMVSLLVDELGLERIRELDQAAITWLSTRNLLRSP